MNPNDSPELRVAFAQLAAKLAGASFSSTSTNEGEAEDLFEDAVPYQQAASDQATA
jgi:hypothetical protein